MIFRYVKRSFNDTWVVGTAYAQQQQIRKFVRIRNNLRKSVDP